MLGLYTSKTYPYALPDLPYATSALEPSIDEKTMEIHWGKHHNTYVTSLNQALANHSDLQTWTLSDLLTKTAEVPAVIKQKVINHAGGHANHSLFWHILERTTQTGPTGELMEAIQQTFGAFEDFKTAFNDKAKTHFGSGWAWLVLNADKTLEVIATPNQNSPLMENKIPILGLDVWEHAYYLKYQNRRPEYIEAFWLVINWPNVEALYKEALAAFE